MSSLGRFAVVRLSSKGDETVVFQVPARLRPEGFPATIPLRPAGNGRMSDTERLRLALEIAELNAELDRRRAGPLLVEDSPDQSWARLVDLVLDSSHYRALSAATRQNYRLGMRRVIANLDGDPLSLPANVTESQIEKVLNRYESSAIRYTLRTVFNLLLAKAYREGWRATPLELKIKITHPTPKIHLWEKEDVEAWTEYAIGEGALGLAAFIEIGWEIGARPCDIVGLKYGRDYQDGVFRFDQRKTMTPVTIPVGPRLRGILDRPGAKYGDPLIINHLSGDGFREARTAYVQFCRLRKAATTSRLRYLNLRHLRHSCVVQLARAGCTVAEIASVTGHAYLTVHVILRRYLPVDTVCAWNAMEKRERMRAGFGPSELIVEGQPRTFIGSRPGAPVGPLTL